jgi:hypothetical protein
MVRPIGSPIHDDFRQPKRRNETAMQLARIGRGRDGDPLNLPQDEGRIVLEVIQDNATLPVSLQPGEGRGEQVQSRQIGAPAVSFYRTADITMPEKLTISGPQSPMLGVLWTKGGIVDDRAGCDCADYEVIRAMTEFGWREKVAAPDRAGCDAKHAALTEGAPSRDAKPLGHLSICLGKTARSISHFGSEIRHRPPPGDRELSSPSQRPISPRTLAPPLSCEIPCHGQRQAVSAQLLLRYPYRILHHEL